MRSVAAKMESINGLYTLTQGAVVRSRQKMCDYPIYGGHNLYRVLELFGGNLL